MLIIVGKRRKGKTTLAKQILRNDKYDQVFILDFLREYQYLKNQKNFYVSDDIYELESFCEKAWDAGSKKTKTLVVFDEIHRYGRHSAPIAALYRFAGHWNIDIIAISHKFTDFNPDWREQADKYCVFQLTDRTSKNFLKDYVSDEEIEKISHLDTLQYVELEL